MMPVLVTVYVLGFTFRLIDSLLGDFLRLYIGRSLPGVGFLVTVALIFLIGLVATNVIGHKILKFLENWFARLPLVKPIYTASRQIIGAFSSQRRSVFQSVGMIEYPRKGIYAVGFVTGEGMGEVQHKTSADVVTLFLPTTPNPTSGFLLLVPRAEIVTLDMTVEEALKLIISGGVVAPEWENKNLQ
jgi:uncharacterized membrane protein